MCMCVCMHGCMYARVVLPMRTYALTYLHTQVHKHMHTSSQAYRQKCAARFRGGNLSSVQALRYKCHRMNMRTVRPCSLVLSFFRFFVVPEGTQPPTNCAPTCCATHYVEPLRCSARQACSWNRIHF